MLFLLLSQHVFWTPYCLVVHVVLIKNIHQVDVPRKLSDISVLYASDLHLKVTEEYCAST